MAKVEPNAATEMTDEEIADEAAKLKEGFTSGQGQLTIDSEGYEKLNRLDQARLANHQAGVTRRDRKIQITIGCNHNARDKRIAVEIANRIIELVQENEDDNVQFEEGFSVNDRTTHIELSGSLKQL
jgi:hypothetical protein